MNKTRGDALDIQNTVDRATRIHQCIKQIVHLHLDGVISESEKSDLADQHGLRRFEVLELIDVVVRHDH